MKLVDRLEANTMWEPNSGCRIWMGALVRGHGVMKIGGELKKVHRVMWELERGRIPEGLWVLHSCGLSACCNVDHLRLGDQAENARDRKLHGGYEGRPGGGVYPSRHTVSPGVAKAGRSPMMQLTHDDVRRALDYDPETGVLTWRTRADRDHSWNMRFSGEVAGNITNKGYRMLQMSAGPFLAHRLIWLWMTSEMPSGQIDHINGDRSDNRWCNLRLATNSQNQMNRALSSKNVSGVKGVTWNKKQKTWVAHLTVNEKQMHLGQSRSLEIAVKLRRDAEAKYHGEYAHKGVE
jgi:hypothetical protein